MAVLSRLWPAKLQGLCRLLLVVLFAGAIAEQAFAQDAAAASQIKAAFLHKFATYVQGPDTAFEQTDRPLVFGVAGSQSVYTFLTELVAMQNADMRDAEVRQVDDATDLDGVNVLFVGQDAADADALLQQAVAASMLTVTDTTGPQPQNSMIHFFVADDRVRFDVSVAPADAAGLRLSSRLLQVARQVIANDAETGD